MTTKQAFENTSEVKNLRRLEKEGSPLQQAEAKAKLKYAWYIWELCWLVAFQSGEQQGRGAGRNENPLD